MKKFFVFAIAAATMAVGCQKIQDLVRPGNDNVTEDEYAAYPVTFGTNVATVSTKAAIENVNGLAQDSIFVYGINNEDKELLVEKYKIETPLATENQIENVYYGANKETYSFYGYYAGDLKTTPTYADGVITVPVAITGQEDLMIGLTNKNTDLTNKPDNGKTVDIADLYSAKSARRGVKPNLVFNHQLVRFDFNFTDGSELDPDGEESVWIEKLDITTVAAGNLVITHDATNPTGALVATGAESTLSLGMLNTEWTDTENAWTPLVKFGKDGQNLATGAGTIMVMPKADGEEQSYAVKLHLKQTGANAVAVQDLTLAMSGTDKFEAGKKYVVNIKVYGMQAVIVDVTVNDWVNGGSFEYDPDENDDPVFTPES